MNAPQQRLKPSEAMPADEAGVVRPITPAQNPLTAAVEEMAGRVRRGGEVLTKAPTTWLIRNYLPAAGWGVGYGRPGGGKSFHALSLALELARGGEWAGQAVEPMAVLYVIAERPAVLGDRQHAWATHHRQPIPENFHEITWAPQLHQGADVEVLAELIARLGIRFVVIDTLAQCTLGLEENASTGMSLVVGALGRLVEATNGGAVHVIHHTGKDPTKGMRGSSVLLGAADYTYEIGGDPAAIRVSVEKLNAATQPLPEWYRLEGVPLPPLPGDVEQRSGAVLVPTTGKDAGTLRAAELVAAMAEGYQESGVSRVDVEALLGCHRNTATKVLQAATKLGWLKPSGRGSAVRYYLTDDGLQTLT